MDGESYITKVNDFISTNDIVNLKSDDTHVYVKNLNREINKCVNLFNERTHKYLKSLAMPNLRRLRVYKIFTNQPYQSHPLVNFTTALGFSTAKIFVKLISDSMYIKTATLSQILLTL